MKRRYKILDNVGNPLTLALNMPDGTVLELKEFSSIEVYLDDAVAMVHLLESKGMDATLEVINE